VSEVEMTLTKEEQLKKIQGILGDKNQVPFFVFNFGKFKGMTLEFVYKNHPDYLKWLYHSDIRLPRDVESFVSLNS